MKNFCLDLDLDSDSDLYIVLNIDEDPIFFNGIEVYPSEIMSYMGCQNYTVRTENVTIQRKLDEGLRCDIIIDATRNIIEIFILNGLTAPGKPS